ncbi:MAG TPA: FHA domain-containing protein [Bryobacteraceae bacterium]|nr:FHA domain-containing protein [Bryobacteraceae bacterium]
MDRTPASSATARDVILEIVRNMKEGLEPLHYSTLPPAIYHVYLHPDDMDRLRGILPRIVDEAKRALDAEVEHINRGSLAASLAERLKLARRGDPKISAPEGGWQIRILENTEEEVSQGDVVIYSELALPAKMELSDGSMTKRIATRKLGGAPTAAQTSYETRKTEAAPAPGAAPANSPPAEDGAVAVIEYDDQGGHKTFRMTKNEIVVGRGGRDYWTDVKLDTLADVSREHCRLRRDPESGRFFLKDLSRLGTTVNGEPVPSSVDFSSGEKRDLQVEAAVPAQARIGLAGVVFLEFRSLGE